MQLLGNAPDGLHQRRRCQDQRGPNQLKRRGSTRRSPDKHHPGCHRLPARHAVALDNQFRYDHVDQDQGEVQHVAHYYIAGSGFSPLISRKPRGRWLLAGEGKVVALWERQVVMYQKACEHFCQQAKREAGGLQKTQAGVR